MIVEFKFEVEQKVLIPSEKILGEVILPRFDGRDKFYLVGFAGGSRWFKEALLFEVPK